MKISRRFSGVGLALILMLFALQAGATVRFVVSGNLSAATPFTNWLTAAATIQEAIDSSSAGDEIVVTNGFYATGGRPLNQTGLGTATNRLAVVKPVTIRSVNGPSVTIIQGKRGSGFTRCAYLTNGASLIGFTLTNGAVSKNTDAGGGVWCESTNALVTGCVLLGNSANLGGGAYLGTLSNCALAGNDAVVGGGCARSMLQGCVINANTAGTFGGGASECLLNNCLVVSNSVFGFVRTFGGGAYGGTLINCVLSRNKADSTDGGAGGGAVNAVLNNCIVYYNQSRDDSNYVSGTLDYTCTIPMPPAGFGNVTNEPAFLDLAGGNYRLSSTSPCINSGRNLNVIGGVDLAGLPRIAGGTVDMGAYEFQSPATQISIAWLLQQGLPIDGSVDHRDTDLDTFDTLEEWKAGTDPNNPLSILRMLPPVPNGANVVVRWISVPGKTYYLERSTDLGANPRFRTIAIHVPADPGAMTSYLDLDTSVGDLRFYRVGVE